MKNVFIIFILLFCGSIQAQKSTDGFSYQAVVRSEDGKPISNKEIFVSVNLYAQNEVVPLYSEEHNAKTDAYGQLSIIIGDGNIVQGDLNAVPWETESIFYSIELVNEKEDLELISEAQLLAVPYALHAKTAGTIKNLENDDLRGPQGTVWHYNGNAFGSAENKLGHIDKIPVKIVTDNRTRILISEDGPITISPTTTLKSDLRVEGRATFEKNTTTNGDAYIQGNETLKGNLVVGGTIDAEKAVNLYDELNVFGTSNLNGPVNLSDDVLIKGKLEVQKSTQLNDLTVQTDAEFRGALGVIGKSTLDSELEVKGNSTLQNTLNVNGNSFLNDELTVEGKTILNGTTEVVGANPTILSGSLNTLGATKLDNTLVVGQESTFKGQSTFDVSVDGLQTEQESYPVLIKGSKQGLAIEVTPIDGPSTLSGRGNNYISFWKDGKQTGRIEGMSKADLDPTGLVSLISTLINTPPDEFNLGIDFENIITPPDLSTLVMFDDGSFPSLEGGSIGTFPSLTGGNRGSLPCFFPFDCGEDGATAGSLPTFPTLSGGTPPQLPRLEGGDLPGVQFANIEEWVGFIDFDALDGELAGSPLLNHVSNFGQGVGDDFQANTPAALIWQLIEQGIDSAYPKGSDPEGLTNFKSQILSNYTLDVLTQSISTVNELVGFLSSISSILDPGDILSEGSDLIVALTNLIIYGSYADINLGVAYESGSGDYAEWLLRANPSEFISPGDVVGVIGGKISKSFNHADKFMVVSTAPLLLGNMPPSIEEEAFSEKIAFMGQVPVKVQGKVNIGDYILPSGNGDGLAIAVSPDNMLAKDYQRIVGVAWSQNNTGKFVSLINTAIGINQNDMAKVVDRMQVTLNSIQTALVEINPDFKADFYNVHSNVNVSTNEMTLSPFHKSNHKNYFEGKSYVTNKEMLADVKRVLTSESSIDLTQFPMVEYILDNPEKADEIAKIYQPILEGMKNTKKELEEYCTRK